MTVVELLRMMDKGDSAAPRGADGTVAAVADRSAVAEDRAFAPQTTPASQGWPPVEIIQASDNSAKWVSGNRPDQNED